MNKELYNVGGQAVIEGVMMRSPKSLAIAVRRPTGEIVVKEGIWRSLFDKIPILKRPFLRGTIVLIEALVNGIQALTFSANQASLNEQGEEELSSWTLTITIIISLGVGLLLFVFLPHLLTRLLGILIKVELPERSFAFHVIDGIIKVAIFIGYIVVISFWKDIQRIFEYHGAEHKSIYTYEAGEELTVENARKYTTLHPRCGTSFIIMVLLISIFMFTVVFPFMPAFHNMPSILRSIIYILIKIILMFPIAGLAYEFVKFSGKNVNKPIVKLLIIPGLMLQKLTTKEPSDEQLEVALIALKKTLWREEVGESINSEGAIEIYKNGELVPTI